MSAVTVNRIARKFVAMLIGGRGLLSAETKTYAEGPFNEYAALLFGVKLNVFRPGDRDTHFQKVKQPLRQGAVKLLGALGGGPEK